MDIQKKDWQPKIIELVGPAGAGKTSISKMFSGSDEGVTVVKPPNIRTFQDLPLYLAAAIYTLPVLLHIAITRKRKQVWLSRKQVSWLILLNWYRILLKSSNKGEGRLVVIDQGPVYLLSVLYKFGPENFNAQLFARWWKNVFTYFAQKLNLIIYLDASNDDLIQRINERKSWHTIKERSETSSNRFLIETRDALEETIELLTCRELKPQIIRFDTASISQSEIVNTILRL